MECQYEMLRVQQKNLWFLLVCLTHNLQKFNSCKQWKTRAILRALLVHYDSGILEGMHGVLGPSQQIYNWKPSEYWGTQKEKHRIKIDRKYTKQMLYFLLLGRNLEIIPIWAIGGKGKGSIGMNSGVGAKFHVFSTKLCQEHQILVFYHKDPSGLTFYTHCFIESGFRNMTWTFIPKVI